MLLCDASSWLLFFFHTKNKQNKKDRCGKGEGEFRGSIFYNMKEGGVKATHCVRKPGWIFFFWLSIGI